jgi:ATP-dependent RNA helicase RhlE
MQGVNTLTSALSAANFKVASLHGKRSQHERTSALNSFKSGKVQILVATDVAARGLHVPRLPYIVNYDFPGNLETYIHRVGRTGIFGPYICLLSIYNVPSPDWLSPGTWYSE